MNVNLNIDQILQHVLLWDFSVTVGGRKYATRRPSLGELGAILSVEGKTVAGITDLLNGLFVEPPDIRWELPIAMAFIEGYVEYFTRHSSKKDPAAEGNAAAGKAREMVASQWSQAGNQAASSGG
jgi:hypothetical protein